MDFSAHLRQTKHVKDFLTPRHRKKIVQISFASFVNNKLQTLKRKIVSLHRASVKANERNVKLSQATPVLYLSWKTRVGFRSVFGKAQLRANQKNWRQSSGCQVEEVSRCEDSQKIKENWIKKILWKKIIDKLKVEKNLRKICGKLEEILKKKDQKTLVKKICRKTEKTKKIFCRNHQDILKNIENFQRKQNRLKTQRKTESCLKITS